MSQTADEQGTPLHRKGTAAAATEGWGSSNADGGPQTPARRPESEGGGEGNQGKGGCSMEEVRAGEGGGQRAAAGEVGLLWGHQWGGEI